MSTRLEVVQQTEPAPPYPADVRAKGMDFRLNVERYKQSDTWALAPPELRPWLLMLWAESWDQRPAGSFPDDDEIIAARIGMPLTTLQTHRKTLLRGWRRHTDGRLYHPVVTSIVLAMVEWRRAERERIAKWREKHKAMHLLDVGNASVTRNERTPEPEPEPEPELKQKAVQEQADAKAPPALAPTLPKTPKPERRQASRLPDGWFLPDEWRDWAVTVYKIDPQRAVRISLDFRDYWVAKSGRDACKLDWQATWRRWLRRELGDD